MSNHALNPWLALMVGNSRLHWAWFIDESLQWAWDTPQLSANAIATLIQHQLDFNACPEAIPQGLANPPSGLPLWFASVAPAQTSLWQAYAPQHIMLDQIPLAGLYPTLGIDRALALFGAAKTRGLPVLVIDAGTALTLTGANAEGSLIGGAILPGLQLQLRSLNEHTAALPPLNAQEFKTLPPRWVCNTPEAIQSGVIYTLLAGLRDFMESWLHQFPESAIVLTGGDSLLIEHSCQQQFPQLAALVQRDPYLIFWGMRSVRQTLI
ncbi:MAG TPA: pantothenate kinase [Coleofasciculaceae cyanobacterium]